MNARSTKTKVLILGSGPFAGLSVNSASDIALELRNEADGGMEIHAYTTPVSYEDLPGVIFDAMAEHEPDIALGLGQFIGSSTVRVETTAVNMADFDVADNHGRFVRCEPLDETGPAARFVNLPYGKVVTALLRAGIPARVSHHAGTHLCNLTLYSLLSAQADACPGSLCGFIHVPLLPEQVAEMLQHEMDTPTTVYRPGVNIPSMSADMQVRAARVALAEIHAALQAAPEKRRA